MFARRLLWATFVAIGVASATTAVHRSAGAQLVPGSNALLARGEYLTGPAGQCSDCHGQGLAGSPHAPPGPPGVVSASSVPSLRGLHMFATDGQAITFLMTTKLADGSQALPPMPRYLFDRTDASAIVAYLRSLR